MKTYRRILIALITLAMICLISNLALAEDSLHIDSSGNVGIGTTDPTLGKLQVDGGSSPVKIAVKTTNLGTKSATLRLENSLGAFTDVLEITHGAGHTYFQDGNGTERMTLDLIYGNVGIGTTNPTLGKLQVDGGSSPVKIAVKTTNLGTKSATLRLENSFGNFNDVSEITHGAGYTHFQNGIGAETMTLDLTNNRVGIGNTSPEYKLDVIGDIHLTGKLTSDGGNDPPYVLYNYETRQSVVNRVVKEVPPDKLDGAVLFFNGETSKMEILLPKKGEFRSLPGQLLESIGPITNTFEVEDRYFFDRKSGKVDKYKVRKIPAEKYKIKEGHVLDSKTGRFFKVTRDENGKEEKKIEATKEQAVELEDLSVKGS